MECLIFRPMRVSMLFDCIEIVGNAFDEKWRDQLTTDVGSWLGRLFAILIRLTYISA